MSGTASDDGYAISPEGGDRSGPASRTRLILILGIVFAVVAGIAVLATNASRWKNALAVRSVVVEGESLIPERQIMTRLSPLIGQNMQKLDLASIERSVTDFPYVEQVRVNKEMNGVVRVHIKERIPIARLRYNAEVLVLDQGGNLLPLIPEVQQRYPDLFLVTGTPMVKPSTSRFRKLSTEGVRLTGSFLDALSKSRYARLLIRELHLAADNQTWVVVASSPIRFIVGNEGDFQEKLKKFEIFWQKVVSKQGLDYYSTVDLRFKGRVFVTNPAMQPGTNESGP